MSLTRAGIHPLRDYRKNDGAVPTPWCVDCWSVFISDEDQLRSAVRYVERHPLKAGLRVERYPFLAPLNV